MKNKIWTVLKIIGMTVITSVCAVLTLYTWIVIGVVIYSCCT